MLQIQTYPVDLMLNNYRVAGGKLTKVGVFFADIACSPVTIKVHQDRAGVPCSQGCRACTALPPPFFLP